RLWTAVTGPLVRGIVHFDGSPSRAGRRRRREVMRSLWQRLARGVKRLRQRPEWTQFTSPDWPDHIMTLPVTDQFHAKQGRTTGRCVMRHLDQRLVVYLKRHYRLPAWRGVLATLFPRAGWSPALQEWKSLKRAHALGLPVPRAVAAAEYIGPWCRLRS